MKAIKKFIEILFDKTVELITVLVVLILMMLPAVIYMGLVIFEVITIKPIALTIMIGLSVIWALSVIEMYERI